MNCEEIHPYLSSALDIVRAINDKRHEYADHEETCERPGCQKGTIFSQMIISLRIALEIKNEIDNQYRLNSLKELAGFLPSMQYPKIDALEKTFVAICSALNMYYYHYWICEDITCQLCKTLPARLIHIAEDMDNTEYRAHLYSLQQLAVEKKACIMPNISVSLYHA